MADFFDMMEKHWRNRGDEFTPDKFLDNYSLYGPRQRSEAKDQMDAFLRDAEPTVANMRDISAMVELTAQWTSDTTRC